MKTKIIAVFATFFILLSFAACGKADAAETTTPETGTTAAATITEAATSATATVTTTKAATTKTTTQSTSATSVDKTFTSAQLAEFNGKSGKDAYIAYDGVVYDVTDKLSTTWKNGVHHDLIAGTDLTAQVNSCDQHAITFMTAQFNTYPRVGTYIG